MAIDYTPSFVNYTGQGKFRFWCQSVLPLVYDDSLSYMELLNKMVIYLNRTIQDVAAVETNVDALLNAYNQLQQYVNDYFDNLDVQDEINVKLDGLVEDGTMSELIQPFIDAGLPGMVAENLPGLVTEQIPGVVADQLDEVVEGQIGAVVAEQIPSQVTGWLADNVTPVGSAVIVDKTLTIEGAAADAKATGDAVNNLHTAINATFAPIEWEPTIIAGKYITSTNGITASSSKHARTSLWVGYGFKSAINLANPTYEYRISYYDATGDVLNGAGYLGDSGGYKTGVQYIPKTAIKFGLSFRRQDQETISDVDITAISESLFAFAPTDTTLTLNGIAADANETGKRFLSNESQTNHILNMVNLNQKIPIPYTVALQGKYVASNGNTGENEQYGVTDYIPFGDYDVIYYKQGQVTVTSVCYTAIYDAEKNMLRTVRWKSNADAKKYADSLAYIKKQENEVYMRFTVFLDTDTYGEFGVYGDNYPLSEAIISRTSPNALMSMYESFGVCGASWDCAYYYVNGNTVRKPELSWAANVARRNGNSYAVYAYQGLTTKTWLTSNYGLSALLADTEKNLYILTFGGNDSAGGSDWLGSIADITSHASYVDYDDTFYGNYGKIIEQIKAHAPNALLILVMNYDATIHSNNRGNYYAAVKEIGSHYGIPVMNWAADEWYNSIFVRNALVSDHPTAPIYSGIAMAWERIYSLCVEQYYNYFKSYLG